MTDGQLIFKPETQYDIKVAKGVISIDFTDLEITEKINEMYKEGHEVLEQTENTMKKMEKQNKSNEEMLEVGYSKLLKAFKPIEQVFGAGSVDKIFPIKSIGALAMFLEALPPHLDKAQEKAGIFMECITSDENRMKYMPEKEDNEEIEEL